MSLPIGKIVTAPSSLGTEPPDSKENQYQHDLQSITTTRHEHNGKISVTGDLQKWRDIADDSFRNYQLRDTHIQQYSYAVVTTEVAKILAEFIGSRRVLDAGAGTGYISLVLASVGVDSITAVDTTVGEYTNKKWWSRDLHFPIQVDDAIKVLEQFSDSYDVVLMSWPCYNTSTAHDITKVMVSGQVLIYQGESLGGCTGDDEFHEFLEENFIEHPAINDKLWDNHYQFPGIHDRWMIYTKK